MLGSFTKNNDANFMLKIIYSVTKLKFLSLFLFMVSRRPQTYITQNYFVTGFKRRERILNFSSFEKYFFIRRSMWAIPIVTCIHLNFYCLFHNPSTIRGFPRLKKNWLEVVLLSSKSRKIRWRSGRNPHKKQIVGLYIISWTLLC